MHDRHARTPPRRAPKLEEGIPVTTYTAANPRTGEALPETFEVTSAVEIAAMAAASEPAGRALDDLGPAGRAEFLRAVAERLLAERDDLVTTADAETALGRPRLDGELNRTVHQLRSFADLVEQGDYLEAVIDPADPAAAPPRPDLRRALVPLGPVAMFGAGNFPFAFGVAGTDTASALAVGCSVVAKAHPGHPATSQRFADAIRAVALEHGLPADVLQLVHGPDAATGTALVTDEHITSVAFTGSGRAGRALMDVAAARPTPIPVYAEMGSVNPVIVSVGAAQARTGAVAAGFVGSMSMGTGQFCTKPGVVFVPAGSDGDGLVDWITSELATASWGNLLSDRGASGLGRQIEAASNLPGVKVLWQGQPLADGWTQTPTVFEVDTDAFLATPQLAEEQFGPACVLVRYDPDTDLGPVIETLPGGLTATIQAEPEEATAFAGLARRLAERSGRLIWNGWPTGVAVTAAQMHGGPYPASSNPAHTSVGQFAIQRFLRPVAYQDWPDATLPPALRDANPLGIRRLVDGRWTTDPVQRTSPPS